MSKHSHIAIMFASDECRNAHAARATKKSHNAYMDESDEKNGGPNHLRAWMRYRKVTGVQLAEALGGGVTAGMVSDLANSKRQLSAKWLRRLAPILNTTPGHLLDHDPADLPSDIVDVWLSATIEQKRQLAALASILIQSPASNEVAEKKA